MKKIINYLMFLLLTFLVVSCDLQKDEASEPVAPNMGSASEIQLSGVTRAPQSEAEAQEIIITAMKLIDSSNPNNGNVSANIIKNIMPLNNVSFSRAAKPFIEEWIVGDSISVISEKTMDQWVHDSLTNITSSTTGYFAPAQTIKMTVDLNGQFNNAVLNGYKINGKFLQNIINDTKMNYDIKSGKLVSRDGSMYMEMTGGYAMSIVDPNGVGLKFIISFAVSGSVSFDETNMDIQTKKLANDLSNFTSVMHVYDENDTEIYTITADSSLVN